MCRRSKGESIYYTNIYIKSGLKAKLSLIYTYNLLQQNIKLSNAKRRWQREQKKNQSSKQQQKNNFASLFFLCRSFSPCWLLIADRQRFSFSHRRYKIFMLFFQQNSSPLFFISRSSSLSVQPRQVQRLKLSRKRTRLCCCFFSL